MTPQEIIAAVLAGISGVSQVIAWIKGQSGISDADKATQVQSLLTANDALYASLKSQLGLPVPPAA